MWIHLLGTEYDSCIWCRIDDELMDGLQYWRLEQSLCTALTAREEASFESCNFSLCFWYNDENISDFLLGEVIIFNHDTVVSADQG